MGKKAVVSGGTKGIGRAIVLALVKEGFDVATASSTASDEDNIRKGVAEINSKAELIFKPCNFSKKHEVQEFADFVLARWQEVDVVVNNVGLYEVGLVSECSDDQVENQLNINFFSAYYLTRPFLKGMKLRRNGFIINICSSVNRVPRAQAASYTISKNALKSFNDVLREEMREYNVKVTAVLPGSVNTPSWQGVDAPVEEFVQPEDLALVVVNAIKMSDHAFLEEVVINPVNRMH